MVLEIQSFQFLTFISFLPSLWKLVGTPLCPGFWGVGRRTGSALSPGTCCGVCALTFPPVGPLLAPPGTVLPGCWVSCTIIHLLVFFFFSALQFCFL